MKLGFIGLGRMGFHMAGHLAKENKVMVYNRNPVRSKEWLALHNGSVASTAAECFTQSDIIFICISKDSDVEEVLNGPNGIISDKAQNKIIVDHSSISAKTAIKMAQLCHNNGCSFLDAPVSGGEAGAINGQLTIMIGGEAAALNEVNSYLKLYAKSITHFGKSGSGQLAKLANQICIAGIIQGLAEAVNFAKHSGIDAEKLVQALKQGAAQSWQLENRAVTMSQDKFDFGFALNHMRKDLHNALTEAENLNISLPLTALVDQFYKKLQASGMGLYDTSALIKNLG